MSRKLIKKRRAQQCVYLSIQSTKNNDLPVFPVCWVLKMGLSLRNNSTRKWITASFVKFTNTFYSLNIGVPFTQGYWWMWKDWMGVIRLRRRFLQESSPPPLPLLSDHSIGILNHIKTKDEVRASGLIYTTLNGSDFYRHWQKTNVKRKLWAEVMHDPTTKKFLLVTLMLY